MGAEKPGVRSDDHGVRSQPGLGLPGLSLLVGWWDYPLGTFVLALAAMFLGLHFSVVTGLNVAFPERRDWHD